MAFVSDVGGSLGRSGFALDMYSDFRRSEKAFFAFGAAAGEIVEKGAVGAGSLCLVDVRHRAFLGKIRSYGKIAAVLGGKGELFKYGFASFLVSNVINNIPMSVLFGGVLGVSEASLKSIYATIIGSNLGACLTPVGALAGIMWTGLLKSYGVKFSFRQFIGYGAVVALPALLAALGGVALVLCYT